MMKRVLVLVLVSVAFLTFVVGCFTYGENVEERMVKHLELHLMPPYRQLIELHREIDYFIFNLDETDPNLYPPYLPY